MQNGLADVVRQFDFDGKFVQAQPHKFGHIHDTYFILFDLPDGGMRRYVLQRINHYVFKNPEQVMENITRITGHLRRKIVEHGGDPRRQALNLVPTRAGEPYQRSADGCYWRAYHFIDGAQTYHSAAKPGHITNAGRAFGRFQQLLSDFPIQQLHETIPDFHHTPKRYRAFDAAVGQDVAQRVAGVQAEIEWVRQRRREASVIIDLLAQGALPKRVTHNDTKFNNVMIDDATDEGICIIDLDTVMPGSSLYDFGDFVRFGANTGAEDEQDLSKVGIDLEVFARQTRGYLDAARQFLTAAELDHLAFSARLLTLECGLRFLTDYLNGDRYFKIEREGHNLDRARSQFKLVEDMERKFEEMAAIVERYRS